MIVNRKRPNALKAAWMGSLAHHQKAKLLTTIHIGTYKKSKCCFDSFTALEALSPPKVNVLLGEH